MITGMEDLLIKAENEHMLTDQQDKVVVMLFDHHIEHIKAHSVLLNNPQMSNNSKTVKIILNHLDEHIKFLSPENQKIIEWNRQLKEILSEV